MFKHVLLATDTSPASDAATRTAIGMARAFEARLTIVHVCELPGYPYPPMGFLAGDLIAPIEQAAVVALEQVLARVREQLPRAESVFRVGIPAQCILEVAAERGADLLVLGTHGRKGVTHLLLGSVAERVVRQARVPVLTQRTEE